VIARSALALAILASSASLALADSVKGFTGPGYLSVQQVTTDLAEEGYTVTKIKADDGAYKVKATTTDLQKKNLTVDPRTGMITSKSADNDDNDN
jgi:hypothetical protein